SPLSILRANPQPCPKPPARRGNPGIAGRPRVPFSLSPGDPTASSGTAGPLETKRICLSSTSFRPGQPLEEAPDPGRPGSFAVLWILLHIGVQRRYRNERMGNL